MSISLKRRVNSDATFTRDKVYELMEKLSLPCFVAQILVGRGIDSPEAADRFLNPSLKEDWLDPYNIRDLDKAVDKLEAAIKDNKRIVVFGDFDLDGISATTTMTRAIRALSGNVIPFIPKRFEEGYGLGEKSLARLLELKPDLVVTVDCGISAHKEVGDLIDAGVEVVITDHHEASETLPIYDSVPVVDPKAEQCNPSDVLAGVGVALKVVQALGSRFGFPYLWRSYTDFATLGTVADLMPMLGENRALVADGLEKINNDPRPAIAALIKSCSMEGKPITSTNIGFSLAPRLNAAGRMGDAQLALDLLMCDDPDKCIELAIKLEEINNLRREIESNLSSEAKSRAAEEYNGERVVVVAGEGWHEGVKGIVAARLAKQFKVPALLFSIEGDEARGSGRSYNGIDLFKAVEGLSDMLIRFGGHGAAVGVTLLKDRLPEFKSRLNEYMLSLACEEHESTTEFDASVHLDELTIENVSLLEKLSPFGQQNPEPLLLARNVLLSSCKAVGASKNHLSCTFTDGKAQVAGIKFHCEDIESVCSNDGPVDAIFTAQIEEWRGRFNVKAMVQTIEPAAQCEAINACYTEDEASFIEELYNVSSERSSDSQNQFDNAYDEFSAEAINGKAQWKAIAKEDPDSLLKNIIAAIIGKGTPHEAQAQMLALLSEGKSVLGVMATGRGKSLIFQTHAAFIALRDGLASVFVYPLRALMSDQAFHLATQFSRFGLECRVLSGETSQEERLSTYEGLRSGQIDIVLTTPEYLSFHAEEVGQCGRIGFMVVDEAHHIGQARAGQRPAYRELGLVAEKLGSPVVLAVTATANNQIANDITEVLPITERVIDISSRDNLHIDDQRGIPNREDYLAHVVMSGEKCIIYVNSREQSVAVARRLRARIPQLAPMIGFYNAGLGRVERARVEELFRAGAIQVLVATSAFGEGIDIPDVRHVILFHMPFSDVEFNQMAGRAGRDGADSWIHLLYGRQDVSMNKKILESITPTRDELAYVYRRLQVLQQDAGSEPFSLADEELTNKFNDGRHVVTFNAITCGLSVFHELGLVAYESIFNNGTYTRKIRVIEDAAKVELIDSIRYREGMEEIAEFLTFRDWAMRCDVHGLTVRVTHPISPDIEETNG